MYSFIISGKVSALAVVSCPLFFEAVSSVFCAITVENNLAYIDPQKCKLCRKCVNECPTGAIRLVGMDPLPKAPKAPAAPAANKES